MVWFGVSDMGGAVADLMLPTDFTDKDLLLLDTGQYFKKFCLKPGFIRKTSCFYASAIGLGTHLGEMNEETSCRYRESIYYALTHGINFIDTALNYRGMKSERDIGKVVSKIVDKEKKLRRTEIVVSSKAGFIPGDIDEGLPPNKYLEEVLFKRNIVRPEDVNELRVEGRIIPHTLSKNYFKFAIEQSRKHLNLTTIPVYYIHNPEVSFHAVGEKLFYKQLGALFEFFENEAANDHIKFYGMATWRAFQETNFPDTPCLSLGKIVELARLVGGERHHFKFIQLPYSIEYPHAAKNKTQFVEGRSMTIFEAAKLLNIQVTISSPLSEGKLVSGDKTMHEMLSFVINTDGVLSAMLGMKTKKHVVDNIGIFTGTKPIF